MKEKIRIPKNTLEKISRTRKIVSPFHAITSYVDIIENYFLSERGKPSKYDSKSGKIKEWSWESYQRFSQKVNSEGFLFNNEVYGWFSDKDLLGTVGKRLEIINPKVISQIEKNIKNEGPLLLMINSKPYVAYLDSIGWSNHEGDYGSAKSGIVVLPITKELKLEGLVDSTCFKK